MNMDDFVSFVRQVFDMPEGQIILHDPRFIGNERKYLIDAMDSNFVSSVGEYVSKFEKAVIDYTGAKYAIAAVNGTSALHISLLDDVLQRWCRCIHSGILVRSAG